MATKQKPRTSPAKSSKKPAITLADSLARGRNPAIADFKAPDDLVTRQISVERIQSRSGHSVRPTHIPHVVELAETISAIGLLEPLVVDRKNRLLAGEHRRCACLLLLKLRDLGRTEDLAKPLETLFKSWEVNPETFPLSEALLERISELDFEGFLKHHPAGNIPIRILNIDAEENPAAAFSAEVAENDKRRDFSKVEIVGLVRRLEDQGFTREVGRPSAGSKPLVPALQTIIGKSRAHVHRLLAGEKPKETAPPLAIATVLRILPRLDLELAEDPSAQAKVALEASTRLAEALASILKTRASSSKKKK